MGCFPETTPYGGLRRSRRDAVGRYEKGPGGNGIARRAMILAQLALGLLPEAAPVGIDNEGISIRDAGPERAPEGAAEQPVQVGMEESARRQPVAGCDHDHAPPVPLPRPFQLGRPGKPAQVCDGHLVKGLSIHLPAVRVRGGHEPENVIAPEGVTDHHIGEPFTHERIPVGGIGIEVAARLQKGEQASFSPLPRIPPPAADPWIDPGSARNAR